MFYKQLLTLLFSATLLMQGCSKKEKNDDAKKANAMISTNEYVLNDLNNTQLIIAKEANGFVLKSDKNKLILLDLFATWCPPCQAEASHLSSLQEKYKDDLMVIGVTIENNIQNTKLQEFRSQYRANYTLVNSSDNRRLIDAVATALQVGERFPIPLMAMYKNGNLINYYIGATQEEFIENDIKKALGK
jgi:thiol-disulfide isomerase/thioredoxin